MFGAFQWFWDILDWLGLSHKSAKILFLGLDNAGKTTLLSMLKDDKVQQHVPTTHPHCEELVIGKMKFRTFDLGGHETARRIWRDYFPSVGAIVFLVDSTDRERFEEASEELSLLLDTPELSEVPFIVLGNKIDDPRAVSEDELKYKLDLYRHIPFEFGSKGKDKYRQGVRPVGVFMCSVIRKMGYVEAFRWLSKFLS
uniref:Small COPII coat GTPase SAR1 n=1 Tax=Chromera velia CCMP2878 TaxID=1169474 RepID=A0A0G4ICT0_9ALVE|eukprot:Cvel_13131.t1-p1 / transcript=Cvel_13131.t1 / gene=Cvel_13131 / organism=Chromera_velia_CCMP2878 / gene_product=Small COPII coat GTPase SAR1, putative / transcript_product=Small COPII coat GTPase SAR1, putative / location=Cvel_scaffold885:34157-34747(+) / protein_length=197 / sequence_SO=supercontig / SO=protein_coding / is_pseudo=false